VIRVTAFVRFTRAAVRETADRLIGAVRRAGDELDVLAVDAARALPNSYGAGDVMLLGAFRDREAYERARRDPYVEKIVKPLLDECGGEVDVVLYTQGAVTVQYPDLAGGVQRTLLVRIEPTVDRELVRQFEADLGAMTSYIDTIRNSSLSHVDEVHGPSGKEWTHVWEQEFATLEGLTGPYMMHGYHWSLVDTWFDLQSPRQIVDPELIHAACELRRSILSRA
jgi:hypothetical protein